MNDNHIPYIIYIYYDVLLGACLSNGLHGSYADLMDISPFDPAEQWSVVVKRDICELGWTHNGKLGPTWYAIS